MSHSPGHTNHQSRHGHTASLTWYVVGFILAVLLTVVPFAMVMSESFPRGVTIISISVMAAVQILVHLICFLHLDRSPEQRSNIQVGLFSLLIVGIVIIGSLWVIHNLNVNMLH